MKFFSDSKSNSTLGSIASKKMLWLSLHRCLPFFWLLFWVHIISMNQKYDSLLTLKFRRKCTLKKHMDGGNKITKYQQQQCNQHAPQKIFSYFKLSLNLYLNPTAKLPSQTSWFREDTKDGLCCPGFLSTHYMTLCRRRCILC